MSPDVTESEVDQAALAWLESIGWAVKKGAAIAPRGPAGDGADYRQMVLAQRLRDTLLPKLIVGELRVKSAELFIESVALPSDVERSDDSDKSDSSDGPDGSNATVERLERRDRCPRKAG